MNILITGGAGFIGSAVVRALLRQTNHTVINLDKLTYAGNLDSIPMELQTERYHFEQIDVCNQRALSKVFVKYRPDIVMHLASESHVDRSIDCSEAFIRTNIIGTHTLLECALEYWNRLDIQAKSSFIFHHVSTDEVYGDLMHPDDLKNRDKLPLFTESTPYAPSSPYAASKASSDHLVRSWHRTYGLPVIISNSSNTYGPYHFPEKLIPHMILNALKGQPLPVYGDGNHIRDWLYVEDHAQALIKVATSGCVGETFNIGGRNEKRNIEVVSSICDLLDTLVCEKPDGVHSFKELIFFVKDRPGHDRRYAVDTSKIERRLGWVPSESFTSGLRKTVKWYLNNPFWWRRVLSGEYQLVRKGRG